MRSNHRVSRKLERHNLSGTPEYNAWAAMKQRCYNPKSENYKWYGARGIKVCERWRESFKAFYNDMGERPIGTSIDRRNNDGHYSCGTCSDCVANGWTSNCHWATKAQQDSNRRPKSIYSAERVKRLNALIAKELAS